MNESTDIPKLLKPREAAAVLAISESSLWRLADAGELPRIRVGHAVRFAPADLAEFVERQRDCGKLAC